MSRLQAGALAMSPQPIERRPRPSRAPSTSSAPAGARRRDPGPRRPARGAAPTRRCSNGSWSTWSPTRVRYSPPGRPPIVTASEHGGLGRDPGHRPRARASRSDELGAGLPAVPAPRRPRQRHRRRPRPRPVPRAGRGDGRHAAARDHPRRRADHDRARCRRPTAATRAAPAERPVTRVLVVDDEPQILRALRINLRARQYDVVTAATGAEALRPPPSQHPDLVVLDLGLPDIDGVEVIRGLRELDAGADHRAVRAAAAARTRSTRSTPAPTTTSPSRSASTSCWPGSGRSPGGAAGPEPRRAGADRPVHRRPAPTAASRTRRPGRRRAPDPHRVAAAGGPAPPPRASWSASASCCSRSGGRPTSARPTTCASTWPSCAASSSPIPARPRHLLTEPGMGYRFQP